MQAIIKQAAVPDIFGVGFILVNGNGHRLIALTDILIFTLLILFLRQKKHDVLLAVGKLVTVLQYFYEIVAVKIIAGLFFTYEYIRSFRTVSSADALMLFISCTQSIGFSAFICSFTPRLSAICFIRRESIVFAVCSISCR